MELLENQDLDKIRLMESSERHRRDLEKEVTQITARTERIIINALVIGGSLALTYFLVSRFSGAKKRNKKAKKKPAREYDPDISRDEDHESAGESSSPSMLSQIGSGVMNQAFLILLDIGCEKLKDYLQTRKETDGNS